MMSQNSSSMQTQGGTPPRAGAFHILLVDDDIALVECMKTFLEEVPDAFEVATAHSGDEAFLKLVDFKPEVIVLDVGLPDMNGIEILNPIQDIRPSAHIVVLTGNASAEQRDLALRRGAVRFLEKPVDLHSFRRLLHELGSKSRQREASNLEGGMELLELVQMMYFCQKTTAVRFIYGHRRGTLRFDRGEVVYVDDGSLTGEKAFYNMVLLWGEGRFYTLAHESIDILEQNNWTATDKLLLEAAVLLDGSTSAAREAPGTAYADLSESLMKPVETIIAEAPTVLLQDHPLSEEDLQERIKASLSELLEVEGARACLLVDGEGYVIQGRARRPSMVMDKVAAVLSANLGSTHAIGRELLVGAGQLVMLEFEKGTLLARSAGSRGTLALLVDEDAKLGHHRCQLMKVASEISLLM